MIEAPPSMLISAMLPWYGSKRALAGSGRLVVQFGRPKMYVTLFGGSLADLFALEPCSLEISNDLHGHATNLARVLASDRYEDLMRRASRVVMCRDLYNELRDELFAPGEDAGPVAPSIRDVADEHVEAAWRYLAVSWIGINGISGTKRCNQHMAARFTPGGGHGGTRWRSVLESIPAWHWRLLKVHIERMDAFELARRIDDVDGVVIYADPPYFRKGDRYLYDAPSDAAGRLAWHTRLRDELARFKNARVVVSYYDEPEVRALYAGWTFVEVSMNKALVAQRKRGEKGAAVVAPEVLIINGPSYDAAGQGASGLFGADAGEAA